MLFLKRISLSAKFLLIGLILVFILAFGLMLSFALQFKKSTIASYVSKARSIAMAAESVREEMDTKWNHGIFTIKQLQEYLKEKDLERILDTVPVVTAWRTMEKKAKMGKYEFRVPKFSPRNPKNMPDYGLSYQIEGPALQKMKNENLKEYYLIDTEANAVRYFLPIRLSKTCLMCHGDPLTSKALWGNTKGMDPTDIAMENWKEGEIHGAFEIIQSLAPADAHLRQELLKSITIALLGLLAVAVCYYLLVNTTITRPIRNISQRLQNIAKGDADLTQRLSADTDDEIGDLVKNFNVFLDNLQHMISQVAENTQSISATSTELSHVSHTMSEISTTTRSKSESVSSSTHILSLNMEAITKAMNEATTNINLMAASAEEMSATVSEIAQNSEHARTISNSGVQQSKNASDKVSQLKKAAHDITKITETITEISQQTNLLALNATIEASRAGDAGKGFSVVANEIKDLSSETSKATNEIRKQIDKVQENTDITSNEIFSMNSIISDINEIILSVAGAVEEQATATREVANSISQISSSISNINNKVFESNNLTSNINNDISNVHVEATNVFTGSKDISEHVQKMQKMSNDLKKMIEKFTF